MRATRAGFTLVELLVIVLIVAVLAAVSIPQYQRSVETSRAQDAAGMANMLAATSRMYAMDHGNTFVRGDLPADGPCGSGSCGSGTDACDLVRCKYVADDDWGSKMWSFQMCRPAMAGGAGCCGDAEGVACASRKDTVRDPYRNWSYVVNTMGQITALPAGGFPTTAPEPIRP
ncbi:MAG: prepilin-type N-terminal cleavage/methylation domain-containing protein [Elusimicrobia bacterium]|nr:prepilin-type N-terminal cleavage/methylation domain-containing protein [Elusimicrobiota bacterium]